MKNASQALVSPTKDQKIYPKSDTGPRRGRTHIPTYRHHKASGQAVVTLNGKDYYLGLFDTPASREKYARLLAQWEANNRFMPTELHGPAPTIAILIDAFWQHAKTYYRKPDGTLASELATFKAALRPLFRLYGSTPAHEFGPLSLKAVRNEMIQLGWSRSHINKQVSRIRMLFKWAVSEERVESSVYERLRSLPALKRGRCEARESQPVHPVPDEMLEAVEPFVSRQVWAIIRLQRLTGARAGEIVIMRPVDLDMSDPDCWVYQPKEHKTAHYGHLRQIPLNAQAQQVIKGFLTDRSIGAHLFSPAEAESERLTKLHQRRSTPMSCGNRPGTNKRKKPRRTLRDHYDVAAYRRAIIRACDKAFPPPEHLERKRIKSTIRCERWETESEWQERLGESAWDELRGWRREHRWHPHQIRHTVATEVRRRLGCEKARVALGHRSISMTELYAEITLPQLKEISALIG